MHSNRDIQVITGSEGFPSKLGVLQEDNLSPSLFNLFINYIPKCFDGLCMPVSLGNSKLNCLMYADDLVLLSVCKTAWAYQAAFDRNGD